MENILTVDIDKNNVFKYILIRVHNTDENNPKHIDIVRGYLRSEWHADILDEVQSKLKSFDCECLGGGRISHDPNKKKIHVYGYSQGFGKADHEVTATLLKEVYSEYTISISDEGY